MISSGMYVGIEIKLASQQVQDLSFIKYKAVYTLSLFRLLENPVIVDSSSFFFYYTNS